MVWSKGVAVYSLSVSVVSDRSSLLCMVYVQNIHYRTRIVHSHRIQRRRFCVYDDFLLVPPSQHFGSLWGVT